MYILKRPEQAISDYHIKTKIEDMIAKVELDMKFYFPVNVKISIEDRNGAVVAVGSIAEEGAAVLKCTHPGKYHSYGICPGLPDKNHHTTSLLKLPRYSFHPEVHR